MSEQLQNTGVGYWACRACSAYAANMNRRMKQIEDKMERYNKELDTTKAALQRVGGGNQCGDEEKGRKN